MVPVATISSGSAIKLVELFALTRLENLSLGIPDEEKKTIENKISATTARVRGSIGKAALDERVMRAMGKVPRCHRSLTFWPSFMDCHCSRWPASLITLRST